MTTFLEAFAGWVEERADLQAGLDLEAGGFRDRSGETCTAILLGSTMTDPLRADMQEQVVQLLTRAPNYWTAYREAVRIYEKVINQYGVALSGWILYSVTGGGPQSIGPDAKGRTLFSTNLSVLVQQEGLASG